MNSANAVFDDTSLASLEEQNKIPLLQENLFMLPAGLCDLIRSYVFPKVGSIVDALYMLCTINILVFHIVFPFHEFN
jgi:hypothetical protein